MTDCHTLQPMVLLTACVRLTNDSVVTHTGRDLEVDFIVRYRDLVPVGQFGRMTRSCSVVVRLFSRASGTPSFSGESRNKPFSAPHSQTIALTVNITL